MAEYNNENRGVLFTNDKKLSPKHPDFKGTLNVGGVDYWLSAWNKQSAKGNDFISVSVEKKDAKPVSKHSEAKANAYVAEPLNDEIPFAWAALIAPVSALLMAGGLA